MHALEDSGVDIGRHLIAGIGSPDVRQVAVRVVFTVPVFLPLLHLSVLAYLIRGELSTQGIELIGQFGISSEDAGGLGGVLQHVVDHLVVHGHAAEEGAVHRLTVVIGIGIDARMVLG